MSNQCVFRVTGVARVLQLCPTTRGLEGLKHSLPGLVKLQKTMENHHVSWANQRTQWFNGYFQVRKLWVSHVQPKCFEIFIHVGEEITWKPQQLVGGWAAPLKNDGVRQMGWWHSQLNGTHIIHVPNHQPENLSSVSMFLSSKIPWKIQAMSHSNPCISPLLGSPFGSAPRNQLFTNHNETLDRAVEKFDPLTWWKRGATSPTNQKSSMVIGHLIVIIETQNWVLNGIQTTIDGTDPEFQMEATSCSWKPKNVETIYPLVNVYIAMGNHHHVSPVNQLFLWPFSIAILT